MPKIKYISHNWREATLDIVNKANNIIEEYAAQGFNLTLRQLYYQFVSRDWLSNKQQSYNKLGTIISNARLNGLLDWEAIVDRTRNRLENSHWSSPAEIIDSAIYSYARDKWKGQPHRVEIWIEKDALAGVFQTVSDRLDIPLFPCRGYVSISAMWEAGRRFRKYIRSGVTPTILHFGDHDPSGIDMTRDIIDRLKLFSESNIVEINRIALNMNQIEEWSPPPNPAKLTDTRSSTYIEKYGLSSWELDALEPEVLAALAEGAVLKYRDDVLWEEQITIEKQHKESLKNVADKMRKEFKK